MSLPEGRGLTALRARVRPRRSAVPGVEPIRRRFWVKHLFLSSNGLFREESPSNSFGQSSCRPRARQTRRLGRTYRPPRGPLRACVGIGNNLLRHPPRTHIAPGNRGSLGELGQEHRTADDHQKRPESRYQHGLQPLLLDAAGLHEDQPDHRTSDQTAHVRLPGHIQPR